MTYLYPVDGLAYSSAAGVTQLWLLDDLPTVSSLDDLIGYVPVPTEDEFSDYESYNVPDWDGYGAAPVTGETVRAARDFKGLFPLHIPTGDVAPGADGTIGFEWRRGSPANRVYILVDIGPGDKVVGRRVEANGDVRRYPETRIGTGARSLIHRLFS